MKPGVSALPLSWPATLTITSAGKKTNGLHIAVQDDAGACPVDPKNPLDSWKYGQVAVGGNARK